MFFQFRTVIATKKRLYVTYILDNSFLLYRISNKFVQGIAGKKKSTILVFVGHVDATNKKPVKIHGRLPAWSCLIHLIN